MSAGVSDQRMKGQGNQVSNGPKEQLGAGEGATGSEDFEPWRSQQQNSAAHTAYSASVPISTATDLYTAGYYGSGGTYPYQAYGVGDGTWSNGTDPMTFLSGYPHDSYSMDGMFGPSTTFSTPTAFGQPSSFNYFPSNGDYNTWSNQRKYDEYYREAQNMYPAAAIPDSTTIKIVEQAMQSLDMKAPSGDAKDSLSQPKKTTWASIASQPAKPQLAIQNQGLKKKGPGMPPGPIVPGKHNMDIGTWDTKSAAAAAAAAAASVPPPPAPVPVAGGGPGVAGAAGGGPKGVAPGGVPVRHGWGGPPPPPAGRPPPPQAPRPGPQHAPHPMPAYQPPAMMPPPHLPPAVSMPAGAPVQMIMPTAAPTPSHPVLDELRGKNNYNPSEFDLTAPAARFFVIKSYSEDDIHRSIKYEIWCSTEHGNKRLDQAYREREANGGAVFLFFSVNGSGHFCGMAQMASPVDYSSNSSVWSQDKWKGQFKVRWIYVKDVPNVQLRHIRLENNENKPVTNSRDTQEAPHAKGLQVLRIMHSYRHSTSIFDDFVHYEERQKEEDSRKQPENGGGGGGPKGDAASGAGRDHRRGGHDRDPDKDAHRRNNDHHSSHGGGGGAHHKDRDNNRGRGGRGRN